MTTTTEATDAVTTTTTTTDASGLAGRPLNGESGVTLSRRQLVDDRPGDRPGLPPPRPNGGVGLGDTVFGPVPGVNVFVDQLVYRGGSTITDSEGKYSFIFQMPTCPLGGFNFTTDVWAELRYRNFMPMGAPSIPYYLRVENQTHCNAFLAPVSQISSLAGIVAAQALPSFQTNLYADVMFLTGKVVLRNPVGEQVEISDTTHTVFEELPERVAQQFYDFNEDGEYDHAVQGRIFECVSNTEPTESEDVFLPDETDLDLATSFPDHTCSEVSVASNGDQGGGWQGIFFDGEQADLEDFPDLIRLIDQEFRNEPVGVLKSISEADLRNTDILVFRESTGQLILERRGLKQEEAAYRTAVAYDEAEKEVAYRIMLRGRDDGSANIGGGVQRRQSWEEWASEYQLQEPFAKIESDQPRPGEYLKIVAINRASGYTGTARVQLTSAAENGILAGLLDVEVPTITLVPPNLKVWAERDYTVEHGLTQGDERSYTIGNEGAALTSDTTVRIFTEWLDEEGFPLPDELGLDDGAQYGLTGRLAKVVGADQLRGVGTSGDLAEFPIGPGRNTQAVKLEGTTLGTEHFYIHVIGKPRDQECVSFASCPSFESLNDQPEYSGRPKLITPFLTPLWDEDEQWREFSAYRQILAELEANLPPGEELSEEDKPAKPDQVHAWQYRPEYQFSQLDFLVDGVERTYVDEDGEQATVNLLDQDNPAAFSSDDYLTALYSLIDSEFQSLAPLGGEREIVLSLGNQEQRVVLGADRTLRFDDLASLAGISADDYLMLRLYQNNDVGNILWEYAFEFLSVDFLEDITEDVDEDGFIVVSADEPELNLQAILLGYSRRDPSKKGVRTVRWHLEGEGVIDPPQQANDTTGVFNTKLILPPQPDTETTISVSLDGGALSEVGRIRVVPGQVSQVQLAAEGQAYTQGVGQATVTLSAKDAYGNHVADGTPVTFSTSGNTLLENDVSYTVNGQATAFITGSEFKDENASVIAKVGEIEVTEPAEIKPLIVEIESISEPMSSNQLGQVVVKVTTEEGAPAQGVGLDAFSNFGFVVNADVKTNQSGVAVFIVKNPPQAGSATFSVRSGFTSFDSQDYQVINPDVVSGAQVNQLITRRALVVGDKTADGILKHQRFDGLEIDIDYPAVGYLDISGQPNSTIRVALDDIDDPNITPLAAYLLNAETRDDNSILQAPDATGLHNAKLFGKVVNPDTGEQEDQQLTSVNDQIRIVSDHPDQFGRSTYFQKSAYISPGSIPALERSNEFGFRVAAKLAEPGPHTLFDYGNAFELTADNLGRISFSVQTDSGNLSIMHPEAIAVAEWVTIAARVESNKLVLSINGNVHEVPVAGLQTQFQSPGELKIGQGFEGWLSSLKFYDLSYEPLLALGDNGNAQFLDVDIDETGQAEVKIRSLGVLNAEQRQSKLETIRVAVTSGDDKQFASVVSSEFYLQLGAYYVDHIRPDKPEYLALNDSHSGRSLFANSVFDDAQIYAVLPWLVPEAQAGWFGDAVSWVWSGINLVIPVEDIYYLGQQLYYLATNDPDFDPVELSLAAIGTITLIPLAKPLKFVVNPLRNMVRRFKGVNPQFVISFGSVVGGATKKAWDSKSFHIVLNLLPFMIIAGELMLDEEARQELAFMISTIQSESDFLTWVDYLRLPVDGWEGDEEPPEVEISSLDQLYGDWTNGLMEPLVVKQAYAASARRLPVRKARALLLALRKFGDSNLSRRGVISGLDATTKVLKGTNLAALRKTAFSAQTVMASVKLGRNAMSKLYRRARNLRIPPFAIAAMITYLESRVECDPEEPKCKELSDLVVRKLESEFYKKIITDAIISGKKDFVGGFENGAAFHMAVFSYYQLSYEFLPGAPMPVDIETPSQVQLFSKSRTGEVVPFGERFLRRTDILLRDGVGSPEDVNTWVEVKSFKRPVDRKRFTQWDLSKGKDLVSRDTEESRALNRQYFLDLVATKSKHDPALLANKMQWWFHQFERVGVHGYRSEELNEAYKLLHKMTTDKNVSSASLGVKSGAKPPKNRTNLDVFSVKNIILKKFKNELFGDLEESVYQELVINSEHDLIQP